MVDQVVPPSADLSILYPVTGDPPSLAGAVQERLICDEESAAAERFVGGPNAVCALAGMASMPNENKNIEAKTNVRKYFT